MVSRSRKKAFILLVPILIFAALYSMTASRRSRNLPGIGAYPTSIAFSPDGNTLVCASSNGYVQKWMPDLGKWRSFASANNYMSNLQPLFIRLRFSPGGETLYAGGSRTDFHYSSVAHAWDVNTRRRKMAFNYLKSPAFDVSQDGRWAALGYRDTVQLVDLQSEPGIIRDKDYRAPQDFRLFRSRRLQQPGTVQCLAISPDGKTLAVGHQSARDVLSLWSLPDGKPVRVNTPLYNIGQPTFLEWSSDGERLAIASDSQLMVLEIVADTIIVAPWPGGFRPSPIMTGMKPDETLNLAWSPDGRYLFSGGDQVRQWQSEDLKLLRTYEVSGPVAVSPDGRTLATAHRDLTRRAMGVSLRTIR